MAHDTDYAAKIAALNDHFRCTFLGGRVHLTPGVLDLDDMTRAYIINQVMSFDAVTSENDPHGEHDFGAVPISGGIVYWKIDLGLVTVLFRLRERKNSIKGRNRKWRDCTVKISSAMR